jgi:hypothetical protein
MSLRGRPNLASCDDGCPGLKAAKPRLGQFLTGPELMSKIFVVLIAIAIAASTAAVGYFHQHGSSGTVGRAIK